MDAEDVLGKTSGHNNQLRLLHYPAVGVEILKERLMERMPAHTDWSIITLLFQDAVGGLQVEKPGVPGEYIDVTPLSKAMGDVCELNVEDLMARWSGVRLKTQCTRLACQGAEAARNKMSCWKTNTV